ncbi:MAG: adenine phosphoribosyltransferase [Pseudobdellovibrionaceae bacterium]
MNLKNLIRDIADFPKKGILFRDLSPLFRHPESLAQVVQEFSRAFDSERVDAFVGIEARGFILASLLAGHYKKGFIPLRKAGKLPPPVISRNYKLEYGTATLEMSPGSGRVMILDDVLATGGTLQAAIDICENAGFAVEQVGVLVNLSFLNQMTFRGEKIFSLVEYEDPKCSI